MKFDDIDLNVLLTRSALDVDENQKKSLKKDIINILQMINDIPEPQNIIKNINNKKYLELDEDVEKKEASVQEILKNASSVESNMFKIGK